MEVQGVCEASYTGKGRTKFRYRFNNCKSEDWAFAKEDWKISQELFPKHYCLDCHAGIDDWDFIQFEQCKMHKQLKERETF